MADILLTSDQTLKTLKSYISEKRYKIEEKVSMYTLDRKSCMKFQMADIHSNSGDL